MSAWYGELPDGWRDRRVKHVFHEVTDLSVDGDETLLSVSEYFGVKPRADVVDDGDFLSRAESFVGYKRVKANDLAMNIMLAWKTGLGFSAYDGIISPAYSVFRLTESTCNPRYFNYLVRSRPAVDEFRRWSYGIMDSRLRLYPSVFLSLRLPVPPQPTQDAIAGFLDTETARIDALIGRKKRFVDLLLEKRTALITHAVTKGLDRNAAMKDSGLGWLGRVPAHWTVTRLKHVSRIRYGLAEPPAELPDGAPMIRATNVFTGRISDVDMKYVDPAAVPSGRQAWLTPGEIIVVRSGACTGDSAIVTDAYEGAVAGFDMVVSATAAEPRYLAWVLLSEPTVRGQIEPARTRAAQPHLNAEELGDCLLALPPSHEQEAIADQIDAGSSAIDTLVDKTRKSISLLKEYRSALISAAVTGQIDVTATN